MFLSFLSVLLCSPSFVSLTPRSFSIWQWKTACSSSFHRWRRRWWWWCGCGWGWRTSTPSFQLQLLLLLMCLILQVQLLRLTSFSSFFLPLCWPPRTLAGSTLSLFIEHIANMFGHFLYCRLATACLAAFLFCVLCCLGLFSLSLFLPLFHCVFYCMHWCIFPANNQMRSPLAAVQCRLAREVLLLAGFWAGFNLAKYALNAVYFHCMQLRMFASLLGCLFSYFFSLYFSLLCLSRLQLCGSMTLAPKSGTWTLNYLCFLLFFRRKIWQ